MAGFRPSEHPCCCAFRRPGNAEPVGLTRALYGAEASTPPLDDRGLARGDRAPLRLFVSALPYRSRVLLFVHGLGSLHQRLDLPLQPRLLLLCPVEICRCRLSARAPVLQTRCPKRPSLAGRCFGPYSVGNHSRLPALAERTSQEGETIQLGGENGQLQETACSRARPTTARRGLTVQTLDSRERDATSAPVTSRRASRRAGERGRVMAGHAEACRYAPARLLAIGQPAPSLFGPPWV